MHKNHNSALDVFGVICNAISCLLYNLITVRGISTKLHTFVKHIQTICHTRTITLAYIFPPLRLTVGLSFTKSCPLYNLITVRDIPTELHTFVKHIQTTCHAQEP